MTASRIKSIESHTSSSIIQNTIIRMFSIYTIYMRTFIFTTTINYSLVFISLHGTPLGLVDVYYHSTKNRKFRSRVEAAISLGETLVE